MVLRENMMSLQNEMNSTGAPKRDFSCAVATANFQYHGSNPIQHQLSANNNLNSTMVELHDPVHYHNQAPPQALPAAYPSSRQWQEQQFPNIYNPARAFVPLPVPASATHKCTMASINNNVDLLMPNNGNLDDTIDFEQLLVGFRIVHPGPRNVPLPVSSELSAPSIPTLAHTQIMQTQDQQFLLQNNVAKNGVIQMPKRKRISSPEEDMDRKMRQMIKNRASAARSRARKLAREIELKSEISKLREENENLKNMMEVIAETKDDDKKLRRTKSWS